MRSFNDEKNKTIKGSPVKSAANNNNNNSLSNNKKRAMQTNNNSKTITLPKAQHANAGSGPGLIPDELAGGVQDTIYLCNFRVSVDGEWLCLKELQDLDIHDNSGKNQSSSRNMLSGGTGNDIIATSGGFGGSGNGGGSYINNFGILSNDYENNLTWPKYSRDPAAIERSNLVNISKLVVKELLEQSIRFGRMLDSDHLPLQHFFIVLEHVLRHGLRSKKGLLLGPKKELWDLLQSVEKMCPESQDITQSVRDLPTVRTHIGRARAWLRIALMQKKLADYLQSLIENRDEILFEYYEPHALMMSEEVVVIMGILVGLNVIDCNLCVKEEDLDSQQGVIDFSLYLRSSTKNSPEDDQVEDEISGNMTAVLDQKNYIEELNRHLNATVGNLQAKIETLTTTNALMKEDLAIARNSVLAVTAENQALRQNITSGNSAQWDTHSTNSDKSSNDIKEALSEERQRNSELEKEVKLQISLKAETDMAMKLLEKDIHEKQDTIISLRRQLDDIKGINLEMYKKLQECEIELTQKGEMVSRLQTKASQIGDILQTLERKYESSGVDPDLLQDALHPLTDAEKSRVKMQQNLKKFDELSRRHKLDPPGPPSKRMHLKVDPLLPTKTITKIRKSPTVPGQSGNYIAPGEDNHKISG